MAWPVRRAILGMADLYVLAWAGAIVLGFLVLNQGAKLLTDNAVFVARKFGQSRFVIGVLLVSTLAALPEVLVSVLALREGSPSIALGNALSSCVVTVGFVIGLAAFIRPVKTTKEIALRDAVFLATFTIVAAALLLDGYLTAYEGLALIALFIPYTVNLYISQKDAPRDEVEEKVRDLKIELAMTGWLFGRRVEIRAGARWLAFGVLWTVMGAQFIVQGAVQLSRPEQLGIDPWLLAITVVAFGTSLPDIAASYHASKKGYSDLALGEGIGANIVTLLLTLGIMGLMLPMTYDVVRMLPMIISVVVSAFLILIFMLSGRRMGKRTGIVLMSVYVVTVIVNIVLFGYGGGSPFG